MTSYDTLPTSGRSVDPGHLEVLGKQAARLSETGSLSMIEAVVETIGHEKLNSEQVRRVVEFANIEAFNRKFASMSGTTRVVHIDGGPADPAAVLQSLNDAARPMEVTVEALEYSMPPDLVKRSSLVGPIPTDRTVRGLVHEVDGLRSKLSAAQDELIQSVEASKERLSEAFLDLVEAVKSASAGGAAPEEIYTAWYRVNEEAASVVFKKTSAFMRRGNAKVASREINPGSKVVQVFERLVKESQSCQAHTEALSKVEAELLKVSAWLRGGR